MIDLLQLARSGHVTKVFDGTTLPQDKVETLLEFIRSTPASLNIQATRVLIASTEAARERIGKSMEGGFEANLVKVSTASHVLAFCSRMQVPQSHLDAIFAQEREDRKFPNDALETQWQGIVKSAIDMHVYDKRDLDHWLEKQTYLAVGMTMMAAAALDIDVTPMEGFFPAKLDAEFGLREAGYTGTLLLAIGRRDPSDWILKAPKSRLPADRIIIPVD